MANLSSIIRITHAKNYTNPWDIGQESGDARTEAARISDLFERIACGLEVCSFTVAVGGTALVKASATLEFTDVPTANVHAVQVGAITFTAVAEEATPTSIQFKIGTTAAGAAANLAAAVNAHATLKKSIVASVADAVVTFTCLHAGAIGNNVEFTATGGGPYTLTPSTGYLASGAGDDVAATSYSRA